MNKLSSTRTVACCIALTAAMATTSLWAGPEQMTPVDKNPVVEPVVAPECNWTGFYLGLHGGYGWGDSKTSSDDFGFGTDEPSESSESIDPDGFVGGGQIGYNWQFNHFVLGLQAQGGWLDMSDDRFEFEDPPDNFVTADYNWYVLLTPRVGIA